MASATGKWYTFALERILRAAWNALLADAAADGRHAAPMLVRWAVRLHDDSYLWISDPVRVGDATLANADRISAIVDSGVRVSRRPRPQRWHCVITDWA